MSAARVARLCEHMSDPDMQRLAEDFGVATELERVIDAMWVAGDPDALTADLDEIDETFAHRGIDNVTTRTRGYRPTRSSTHTWVCPSSTPCARAVAVVAGAPAPVCHMRGQSLVETDKPMAVEEGQ